MHHGTPVRTVSDPGDGTAVRGGSLIIGLCKSYFKIR
eukprot:SAG31_NODE_42058_length_273_cov_0.655172_1_plen_36_part_01